MTYKQQKQKLLPLNLMLLNICLLTNRLKSTWRSGGAYLCKQNIQQVCQLSRLAYIPTCRSHTNSSQHWPSPTRRWPVSHTTHGPRLSSQVCCTRLTTVQRVIDFSIYDLGDYPWTKVYQKGRRPTTHLSLPSYKISARSRTRSTRYALPKFFTFWP